MTMSCGEELVWQAPASEFSIFCISAKSALAALFDIWTRTVACFFFSSRRRHTRWNCDWSFRRVLFRSEVERHAEIGVDEGVVLRRVQHLQQRRGRIAPPVRADLVDLVEHEDGILRLGAAQPLDDAPGERADVRAAMAPDLRLVAHAAERHAHELSPERPGDALAQA